MISGRLEVQLVTIELSDSDRVRDRLFRFLIANEIGNDAESWGIQTLLSDVASS